MRAMREFFLNRNIFFVIEGLEIHFSVLSEGSGVDFLTGAAVGVLPVLVKNENYEYSYSPMKGVFYEYIAGAQTFSRIF